MSWRGRKEKNIEECYRKQISNIFSVVYNNYEKIDEFFRGENYDLKWQNLKLQEE